jgi:hypothetical protein
LSGVKQTSGYTVALNSNQDSSPGGTVTFTSVPSVSAAIEIKRVLPLKQESGWAPYSPFAAKTLEGQLDRLVMLSQQIANQEAEHYAALASGQCSVAGTCAAAQPVSFSPAGGAYGTPQTITLSSTTPFAQIFYTTDGSPATVASTQYAAPFTLTGPATIRAIATAAPAMAWSTSAPASATYSILETLPFSAQGCYSVGTVVGAYTPNFVRAGTANYIDRAGNTQTCQANQWRQGGATPGVVIESPESLTWTMTAFPDDWCIDGIFSPTDSVSTGWGISRSFWQLGTSGSANSAGMWLDGSVDRLYFAIYDSTAAVRQTTYDFAVGAGEVSARLTACRIAGVPRVWKNGVEVGTAPSGAGTATWTSTPTAFRLGYAANGSTTYLNGTARAVRLCPGAPSACTQAATSERWYALSDSIFNTQPKWDFITQRLLDTAITVDRGTYSGITSGHGLMELSDEVYAWSGSAWDLQTRGTPFSAYQVAFLGYGANDAGYTVQATRRAYDKLVAQARAKGMSLVIGSGPPPRANAGLTAWDGAGDVYDSGGHRAAAEAVRLKYGVIDAELWTRFKTEVTAGRSTIANMMSDQVHPSDSDGARTLSSTIAYGRLNPTTSISATPEVAGKIVTYLFGRTVNGTWNRQLAPMVNTPGLGPLGRIAGLQDQANISTDASARVDFPVVPIGTQQVWACWLTGIAGGNIYPTWNRGQGDTFFVSTGTTGSYANYPGCRLIYDGAATTATKTLDIDGVCTNTCRILGVVYVGVP